MSEQQRVWVVAQGRPEADDSGPGTEARPFRTISRAAEEARPGEKVLVHAGLYREHVAPARGGEPGRPIVYEAGAGEEVIVRGSEVCRVSWRPVPGRAGVFSADLDPAFFPQFNPFAVAVRPSRGNGVLGQVFVDGARLKPAKDEAALEAAAEGWLPAANGLNLRLRLPGGKTPEECRIELTVRPRVFAPRRRGLGYIHVRGFAFEQACNHVAVPQMGMVSCRSGHHWLIEGCRISQAKGLGLDCGQEWGIGALPEEPDKRENLPGRGGHVIRWNHFCDNGQCGLAGLASPETLILGNVVERNAWEVPGFESAGIKMHFFYNGVIEGNLVRDNGHWGIWLDNCWEGARVSRNLVLGNANDGIFFELGEDRDGCGLADNNIVAGQRSGNGVYGHDASDVWMLHNLLLGNCNAGALLQVATDRKIWPWREQDFACILSACSRLRIQGNILAENGRFEISLPLPGGRAQGNLSRGNLFSPPAGRGPLFEVNPNNGEQNAAELSALARRALFDTEAPPPEGEARARKDGEAPEKKPGGVTLDLEQWRASLGLEQESLARPVACALAAETLELRLELAEALPRAAEAPRRLRDYTGAILPERPLPGPFQNAAPGLNVYRLWPIPLETPEERREWAARFPGDAGLQLESARRFLTLAALQPDPAGMARRLEAAEECLARVPEKTRVGEALELRYRLEAFKHGRGEALAWLGKACARVEGRAWRDLARGLREWGEGAAVLVVLDSWRRTVPAPEDEYFICWLIRALAREAPRDEERRRLLAEGLRRLEELEGRVRDPDQRAFCLALRGEILLFQEERQAEAAGLIRAAVETAATNDVLIRLRYEGGKALHQAGRLAEARGVLARPAAEPSPAVEHYAGWARDLLKKLEEGKKD